MIASALLRVRGLEWRSASAIVLADVSFDVRPGEFVAVLGRNGAGKSTLLDLIAGLRAPSGGAIALANRTLAEWTPRERARLLAHMPQSIRADLPVRAESLVLMGRYAGATGWFESPADRTIAAAAMERCDCLQFRARTLATLSGGERQRVLLAACLAQQAPLLLLDEPATFLDVDQQLHCFGVLREEAVHGASCMAVTHDVNLALTFCTRLLVLDRGRLACDVDARTALDDTGWLSAFSNRLRVTPGSGVRPWIGYA